MMVAEAELLVLNRALDGKGVFGVMTAAEAGLTQMMVQAAKRRLAANGLLDDGSSLSEEGVRLVGLLAAYKAALKYVRIGEDVIVGIGEGGTAVALARNAFSGEVGL